MIVLFGAGKIGKKALEDIGKEYVYAFCDNNSELKNVSDLPVINVKELYEISQDKIIIVTLSKKFIPEVTNQLHDMGIMNFFIYSDEFVRTFLKDGIEIFLKKFKKSKYRFLELQNLLLEREMLSKNEIDFLKNKIDIISYQVHRDKGKIVDSMLKYPTAEFYIMDAFEIDHFEPLYHLLRKMDIYSVFVTEPPEYNLTGKWFDYDRAIEILDSRKLDHKDYVNINAALAFSTQISRWLSKYSEDTIRINLQYGSSFCKTAFGVSPISIDGFDYKLSNGEFDRRLCCRYIDETRTYDVGYPRHYEFFDNLPIRRDLLNEFGIETDKPILAYLPTWDENSSIVMYREAFQELRKKYFIISRPHHCTFRLPDKQKDMAVIEEISDFILPPTYPLEKFIYFGDITLIDAKSGSTLESVFLNNNMKMIWLAVVDNVDDLFWEEINNFSCVVNNPKDLVSCVESIIMNDNYLTYRQEHIEEYFSKKNEDYLRYVMTDIISRGKQLR